MVAAGLGEVAINVRKSGDCVDDCVDNQQLTGTKFSEIKPAYDLTQKFAGFARRLCLTSKMRKVYEEFMMRAIRLEHVDVAHGALRLIAWAVIPVKAVHNGRVTHAVVVERLARA